MSSVDFMNHRWFVVVLQVQDCFEVSFLDDKAIIAERVSLLAIQMNDEFLYLSDDLIAGRLLRSFVHLGTTGSDFCVCSGCCRCCC